jgi:hypothetical protein
MIDSERLANRPSLEISRGFTAGLFDLSSRPGVEAPGWDRLPESMFATSLRSADEPAAFVRTALTLVAAMD